jgi:hypothetical protein
VGAEKLNSRDSTKEQLVFRQCLIINGEHLAQQQEDVMIRTKTPTPFTQTMNETIVRGGKNSHGQGWGGNATTHYYYSWWLFIVKK